jgi:hypothetical protein
MIKGKTMKHLRIFLLIYAVMISSLHAAEEDRPYTLWHNSKTGAVEIRITSSNGSTMLAISVTDSSNTNLIPKGIGDFTEDEEPDYLFHNQNSGMVLLWEMEGTTKIRNINILKSPNTNLQVAGIGDFDGDGDNDIATFNGNSGALVIWVMDGVTKLRNEVVLSGANLNLVPGGVGDMDSDGIPDIVLRNNNSGAIRVWTMNNDFSRKGNEYIRSSSNTNLELRGVADMNGDGNNDILNYNTNTGMLRSWLMDGDLAIIDNAEITQEVDLEWSVRGTVNNNYEIIYIDDGAVQCESKGLSKEQTAQKLIDNGIDVIDSQCGYLSNFVVPTLCGLGDTNINLHTINAQNLSDAQALGFESVSTLKRGDDIGYGIAACSK